MSIADFFKAIPILALVRVINSKLIGPDGKEIPFGGVKEWGQVIPTEDIPLTIGDDVKLSQDLSTGNISYAGGAWHLKAGKTYRLTFSPFILDGTGAFCLVRWFDADLGEARGTPAVSACAAGGVAPLFALGEYVFTPDSDTTMVLRCTNAAGAVLLGGSSSAVVQEI